MRVSAAIDTAIAAIAPLWVLRRCQARAAMKAYEATESSLTRRRVARDKRSGDAVVRSTGTSLRAQARHLERNHDIARGAIGVIVNNVCGPHGVGIEPQPRTLDGEIHEERIPWIPTARGPGARQVPPIPGVRHGREQSGGLDEAV